MRVITGAARGRRLKEPAGREIRPTTDQVKEAIFNIVQFDIEGRRVLDLFGGTGQLGIEAASRGAISVDIVDQSAEAVKLIRENIKLTGLDAAAYQAEALSFLGTCGKYDLIFLDPPYKSALAENALDQIKMFDILSIGGIIIAETAAETVLPALEAPYEKRREYRYGKAVKLTTYTRVP